MLITNAHVIYDEDEETAYNDIEICKTDAKTNKVNCFTTATVQYYDKDKDLALLKVADAKSLSAPAQLASQAPHNGDVVNVW
jgi:S1-C subfamily serine protease